MDQPMLLPEDMRSWLPADHVVWFVIAAVERLDTAAFHARSRRGGVGRRGYDPDVLLGLLIYAYAVGQRSSRQIERLCRTDVAFRVACRNDVPDHTVVARFRQVHERALIDLFDAVLVLCARAGMGQLGLVAVDGTKIAAAAAMDRNRDEDGLRRLAERIVADAAAVDAAEDEQFGTARGDELPPRLADPATRKAEIDRLLEEIAAEKAAKAAAAEPAGIETAERRVARRRAALTAEIQRRAAAAQAWAARGAGHRGGPQPKINDHSWVRRAADRLAAAEAALTTARAAEPTPPRGCNPLRNLTDSDSRLMPTRSGFIQGYNAQAATTTDYLIIAADVCQDTGDVAQFTPMLDQITTAANLITSHHTHPGTKIGTILADAGYASHTNLTSPGPDRLIALGNRHRLPTGHTDPGPPPPADAPARDHMAWRLATPTGAAVYKRRAALAEPVNGHLKDRRNLRRFSRRGLTAARAEFRFAAAVTNLLRLFTTTGKLTPA